MVEFKSLFDAGLPAEWLEIIKDIIAVANSGGGCVLFGLANDGQPTGFDASHVLLLDPADITNTAPQCPEPPGDRYP